MTDPEHAQDDDAVADAQSLPIRPQDRRMPDAHDPRDATATHERSPNTPDDPDRTRPADRDADSPAERDPDQAAAPDHAPPEARDPKADDARDPNAPDKAQARDERKAPEPDDAQARDERDPRAPDDAQARDDRAPDPHADDAVAEEDRTPPPSPFDPPSLTQNVKDPKRRAHVDSVEPRPKIPDLFKQYVHTDASAAPANGSGDWISANHANAPTRRAADASSTPGAAAATASGRASPTVNGQSQRVDEPASQRGRTEDADGTEAGALPDWVVAAPTPPTPTTARAEARPEPPTAVPTPAARADAPSPATPTQSRVASTARPAAAARAPTRAVAPSVAAADAREVAPSAADDLPTPTPDSWAPTAFRVPPAPPRAASSASKAALARAARQAQSSRDAATASLASLAAPTTQTTPTTPPTPADAPKPPQTVTAVDSLRASLGWGTRNQDHTTAPRATQGTVGGESTPLGGTATVLPEDAVVDGQAGVSAVGTPTGRYVAEVEALVVARWNATPVPPDQVAMGVSGTVVVELRIDRTGRVLDAHIIQHSGFPILDMQARNAIPDHLPHFPRDVPQDVLVERVTMRTRNATPAGASP